MPAPAGVTRLRQQLAAGTRMEVVGNTFCRDAEGRVSTITRVGERRVHTLDHRRMPSWIAIPGPRGPAVTWNDDGTCTWPLPIGGGHTVTYRIHPPAAEQPKEAAA